VLRNQAPRKLRRSKRLAKLVYAYREAHGLTAAAMAAHCRVSETTILRAEAGQSLSIPTYYQIMVAIGEATDGNGAHA